MPKHLYLILTATFVFGALSGAILFLQNNTGNEGSGALDVTKRGFTVMAYQYGGCARMGCASYQILNNGSYMYIARNLNTGEGRFEDVLTTRQRDALRTLFADTDLNRLIDTKFTGSCPVEYDDVAYRYDITYQGDRYEFDACLQNIENVQLFTTLKNYFEIFSITHTPR